MAKVGPLLDTREAQAEFATARQVYAALQTAMDDMIERCKTFQADMDQIVAISQSIAKSLDALNDEVNRDMLNQGDLVLDSNTNTQTLTLGISIGGIVLGVILAFFCIMGILRVLRELGVFAGAIAAGNFNHQVKITEKGEVGQMVSAMKQIPDALNEILAEYKSLEGRIVDGYLGAEGDAAKFSGDFATLVKDTNSILGRFRMVLENIPSPVVMLDKDQKASYLNAVARSLAGEDYKGKTCFELFAREDFNPNTDGLKIAIETMKSATGETRAHPRGIDMDIGYTAIPMYDANGKLASILQLITDLTSIKQTQPYHYECGYAGV